MKNDGPLPSEAFLIPKPLELTARSLVVTDQQTSEIAARMPAGYGKVTKRW